MERAKEALARARFRAKGKWYLAQQVDSFLEELSVLAEEDSREGEEALERVEALQRENRQLKGELEAVKASLAQQKAASPQEHQRRVCQELEQERDGLIQDIKALRRYRESFRQGLQQEAEKFLEELETGSSFQG